MTVRTILALAAAAMVASPAIAADDLNGAWKRGDGKTRVRIAPCGSNVCATNTWVSDPSGDEKVGHRLVMTLKPNGPGSYTGSAFDPQRNMNFSMNIKVAANSFSSSGCVLGGVVCRSVNWSR